MNWKRCEWIGRYTNELWFRFFLEGKKTNELEDIRMNWGSFFFWKIYEWIVVQIFFWNIYEWIGRYKNELGFRFFFGIINIYFIFSIGGLGFWNPKIYEWFGRYTNELGFSFFFEDIRMNWKIYEWIVVQIFFEWKIYEWIGTYTNELGFRFFFRIIHIHFIFKIGGLLWCSKKLVTGYNFSYTKSYEKLWSEANIEYFVTFLEFRKIEKNTCFYCIENNIFSNYSGWDASKLCFLKNARFSPLPWLRECATGF